MDYTQKMYSQLMRTVARNGKALSVLDYWQAQQTSDLEDTYFIIRHDVDGNIRNALTMARIDAACGIRSTFYFRMTPRLFQPDIIRKIAELGHEIGYHYEMFSDSRGNYEKACLLFCGNLKELREIAPVKTVCMHGRSFSRHNNLDFWQKYSLEEFDLVAEPYLSIDYSDKYYFTDTGLCWDNQKFNRRDVVHSKGSRGVRTTPELMDFINSPQIKKAALLTHTNNWVDDKIVWGMYKSLFLAVNTVKSIRKKWAEERRTDI